MKQAIESIQRLILESDMLRIHKKVIGAICVLQVLLQSPVIQGHEVFGITLDKFWSMSDRMFYVLLLSIVTYPVSIMIDRRNHV